MQYTIETIRPRLAAAVGGEGNLASWYNARTMRCTASRAARELDSAAEDCVYLLSRIRKALIDVDLLDWRQCTDEENVARYVRLWAAWQSAGSRVANWMVTGPAKFPVNANNKRIATEDRRYQELRDFTAGAGYSVVKRARKAKAAAIGAGGIASIELAGLERNLQSREARQEQMRAVNACIRKAKPTGADGDAARLAQLLEAAGQPAGLAFAAAILKPDWAGRRGYVDYQFSNNLAEIKRLRARVAQVRGKLERIEAADQDEAPIARKVGDVEVLENVAEDRLQLIFPGKPSDQVRGLLKGRGFRWSPRNGAWQRQLTNAARDAAQGILAQLQPA